MNSVVVQDADSHPIRGAFPHFPRVQTCAQANFCARNRQQKGPVFALLDSTVKVHDRMVEARVMNRAAGVELQLELSVQEGIVRVHLDEVDGSKR